MSYLDDPNFDDVCTGLFEGNVIAEIRKVDVDYVSSGKGTKGIQCFMFIESEGKKYDREKWGDPSGLTMNYTMWEPHQGMADGGNFSKRAMKEFVEALEIPSKDPREWVGQKVVLRCKITSSEGYDDKTDVKKVLKLR